MEFATAKTAEETWEQYIQRLVEADYLTPEDQEKWLSGKARKWTRKVQVTRFDVVLRFRMTEKNKKQIEQVYAVAIPVTKFKKGTIKLPKPKSLPNDAEFEGFLDLAGQPIVTRPPDLSKTQIRNRERKLKKCSPEKRIKKIAAESWTQYVDRLVDEKFLTKAQREKWHLGKAVTTTVKIPRTLMVPRTQMRNGKEVAVEVPVRQTKTVEIKLPTKNP